MPWVKFLEERYVKDQHANTPQETRFLRGQVVELSEASAARWLRRNACKLVEAPEESIPLPGMEEPESIAEGATVEELPLVLGKKPGRHR